MKVLALYTAKHPLPYAEWVNDLEARGIYVTTVDVSKWRFFQPPRISRLLRHDDYEAIACIDEHEMTLANQGNELSEKTAKVTLLPKIAAPSLFDIKRLSEPENTYLYKLHDADEARQVVMGFEASASPEARLRILGTAKARDIMPVVQLTRKLMVDKRIDWTGDDINLKKEGASCTAFVAGNRPLTIAEASLCAAGIPCVSPDDFSKKIERTDWCTREFHVKQTVDHLLALRQQ